MLEKLVQQNEQKKAERNKVVMKFQAEIKSWRMVALFYLLTFFIATGQIWADRGDQDMLLSPQEGLRPDMSPFATRLNSSPVSVVDKMCGDYSWFGAIRSKYERLTGVRLGSFEECDPFVEAMESVWKQIHPVLTSNPQIEKILFSKDLVSSGITIENAGHSAIILSSSLLDQTPDSLDNTKFNKIFGDTLTAKHSVPDSIMYPALHYELTRQLAKSLDSTFQFTDSAGYGTAYFDQISWLWQQEAKSDQGTFPSRRLMALVSNGEYLDKGEEIVSQWEKSDFSTLFAAFSPQNDFAETFFLVLAEIDGWRITYELDGRTINLNDRFSKDSFSRKRCFVEGLLGVQQRCSSPDMSLTSGSRLPEITARYKDFSKSVVKFIQGTGFFVSSNHLITNFHAVRDACPFSGDSCPTEALAVTLGRDANQIQARTIMGRADMDIALVEVSGAAGVLPARLNLNWSCDSNRGESILSLGYPEFNDSRILFATLGRYIGECNEIAPAADKALYSIAAARGASGSPIFNQFGEVVAMLQGTLGRKRLATGSTLQGIEKRTGAISRLLNSSGPASEEKVHEEVGLLMEAADLYLKQTSEAMSQLSSMGAESAMWDPNSSPKFSMRKAANAAIFNIRAKPYLFAQVALSSIQVAAERPSVIAVSKVCSQLKSKINRLAATNALPDNVSFEKIEEMLNVGLKEVKPLLQRFGCILIE